MAMRPLPLRRLRTLVTLAVVTAVTLGTSAACAATGSGSSGPVAVRLGYFPNLTQASAVVGIQNGIFAAKLGSNVKLEPKVFNAGPSAIEALFSGAIDATYIGPSPTVNALSKSNGQAVRVVAGGASGGVSLVVKPGINTPQDLRGKKIATPQLGNTQDVAARYWLKQQGINTTTTGGGDVHILPQDNAQTLQTFRSGAIDGAWVPEPYASQLVNAGGKVLVDERNLWPGKQFIVTNLLVSTKFLTAHPDLVKKLVEGQVAANDFINTKPAEAQQAVSVGLGKVTGKPFDLTLIQQSWGTLNFLNDPIASSLRAGLDHAVAVGLTKPIDTKNLYDLSFLNEVLKAQGQPQIPTP
jgi:NitT/TauT family transport system substrate-binding protein